MGFNGIYWDLVDIRNTLWDTQPTISDLGVSENGMGSTSQTPTSRGNDGLDDTHFWEIPHVLFINLSDV
jgi:hypothetical protein